jgi:hypothetical protein
MHALKILWCLALPLSVALTGCCHTIVYETEFEVAEEDAENPCEEFCEKTISGENDFTSCQVRRPQGRPAIIACKYESPLLCDEFH